MECCCVQWIMDGCTSETGEEGENNEEFKNKKIRDKKWRYPYILFALAVALALSHTASLLCLCSASEWFRSPYLTFPNQFRSISFSVLSLTLPLSTHTRYALSNERRPSHSYTSCVSPSKHALSFLLAFQMPLLFFY